YDGTVGLPNEIATCDGVSKEVVVEEHRDALRPVQGDTAQVLRVDCGRDVVRHNGAPSARAHDCDEHVSWIHRISHELTVLRFADKPKLTPPKLVLYRVVDAEHSNSLVGELAEQELAPEW